MMDTQETEPEVDAPTEPTKRGREAMEDDDYDF